MTTSRLKLTRTQILAFRRHVGALDERLPRGPRSLRRAAWAGLQDSMPRAALLSIHARVAGTEPSTWEDPSLVQLWGPRYSTYVVAARDLAVFSLGRLPDDARGREVAEDLGVRLHALLRGRRMTDREAGKALGNIGNRIRYAATTGTVMIRWEGARAPTVWTVPRPEIDPRAARLELARRYLHVFGPSTPESFAEWAGIGTRHGIAAFDSLSRSLTPVRTPIGDAWILTPDEATVRAASRSAAGARSPERRRLLPSPGSGARAPGPRRRWPPSALDLARLAGRPPRRRRDRRDVAAGGGDGNGPALAPSPACRARGCRDRSGVPAPSRCRADRRPLGRVTWFGQRYRRDL